MVDQTLTGFACDHLPDAKKKHANIVSHDGRYEQEHLQLALNVFTDKAMAESAASRLLGSLDTESRRVLQITSAIFLSNMRQTQRLLQTAVRKRFGGDCSQEVVGVIESFSKDNAPLMRNDDSDFVIVGGGLPLALSDFFRSKEGKAGSGGQKHFDMWVKRILTVAYHSSKKDVARFIKTLDTAGSPPYFSGAELPDQLQAKATASGGLRVFYPDASTDDLIEEVYKNVLDNAGKAAEKLKAKIDRAFVIATAFSAVNAGVIETMLAEGEKRKAGVLQNAAVHLPEFIAKAALEIRDDNSDVVNGNQKLCNFLHDTASSPQEALIRMRLGANSPRLRDNIQPAIAFYHEREAIKPPWTNTECRRAFGNIRGVDRRYFDEFIGVFRDGNPSRGIEPDPHALLAMKMIISLVQVSQNDFPSFRLSKDGSLAFINHLPKTASRLGMDSRRYRINPEKLKPESLETLFRHAAVALEEDIAHAKQ